MMKNFIKRAIVCAGVVASAMALSSAVVFAADVLTAKTWNIGSWSADKTIITTVNQSISGDDLTYYGRSSNAFNADRKKTIDNVEYTGSLSTGGGSTLTNDSKGGVFEFTPGVDGVVKVFAEAGNTKSRNIYIGQGLTSKNRVVVNQLATKETTSTDGFVLSGNAVSSNGSVYIYVSDNYHIYQIEFTPSGPTASLSSSEETLTVGDEIVLTAGSSSIDNASYSWSTGNEYASVTVDPDDSTKATVKGLKAGSLDVTVTVTGTASGESVTKTATCTVTVVNPKLVETVTITGESNVNLGYATTLTASISPADATNGDVTWSTNDTDKVVLNTTEGNTVKVRTLATGTATIVATAGGKTDSIDLVISAPTATNITANKTYELHTAAKNLGFGADKEVIANGTVVEDSFTVVQTENATTESTSAIIRSNPYLQIGAQNFSYVEFTTSKAFKITVPFASTGGDNVSDLIILDSANTVLAHESVKGTSAKDLVIYNLPAGTYKIASPTAEQGATGVGEINSDGKTPLDSTTRGARLTTVKFEDAVPTADQAASIADKTGITAPDGLVVDALYTEDVYAGYVIFAFKNNETLQNATSLTYQANGQDAITINALYNDIEFADKSVYSKDGYLLTAFATDRGDAVTSITGTFTVTAE